MQRYRHYGASGPAPAEEPHSTQEALNTHEDVYDEQGEPMVKEEALDGLKETEGASVEEAAAPHQAPPLSESKPPPAESKSNKKAAGGDTGGGAKHSVFTWFAVLALLGVWSSVAVVYFDIVDYDGVIARAQEFRMNFSQVLQGKLTAYDTDGDGDFDVEDAKVLLGLKETPSQRQLSEEQPAEPAEDQSSNRQAAEPAEEESVEAHTEESTAQDFSVEEQSTTQPEDKSVEEHLEESTTEDLPTTAVPLPAFVEEDFVAEEDVDAIDTSGVLVEEPSSQETVVESIKDLTSSKVTQEEEEGEPAVETEQHFEPEETQSENTAESSTPAEPPLEEKQSEPVEAHSETAAGSSTPEEAADHTTAEKPKEKAKKKKAKLLNKLDKSIKAELDAAEKLRKKGKVEAALQAFETLVHQHPQSPRAHYGKAQAEDDLAEKQRSNDMLQKAIGSYGDAADLPDATPDLIRAALKRRAERQQFLGRMRGAVATLEKLVQIFPKDISLKNDLGVSYLLLGDNKGAKAIYEEVLAVAPSDGFAKVHYGFILKSENKIAESIPYLKEGLESGEPGTDDGRFYFHLGDALQRVGDKSEAYHWYQVGHERGHFASVWQRSLYNVDGLKAQPWWTPNETGYTDLVKALEKNWKMIRDEAMAMMDQNTGQFVPEEENLREKGEWGQYTLWQQGKKSGTSCQAVPKTCSLLERFPEATGCKRGQIKFSVMQPGTHVWPHTGPTNCRLRMHLGLIIPKQGCTIRCTDQTREWEEGKVLIFDDSFEHEVWQDADTFRLIFIVDVWHPQLTASQRQTLSAI
ncbi:aspartyl/asparaginyl beta-hydroxylase isoform X11 [Syngnathus scovelli]|uniref:aspartyl/asparaginyl beta-hydroxylase isoform X11 n=1 Tax=Syngnathus scovelli TaxID=161590 RepID=UPI0035C9E0EF